MLRFLLIDVFILFSIWLMIFSRQYKYVDGSLLQEIHNEKNCWRLLVNSVCPSVYGHEMVKAGMLLSLIGGASSSGTTATRGDPHVLVVGDPGLGKSHMLHAAASIAPRGIKLVKQSTQLCINRREFIGLIIKVLRFIILFNRIILFIVFFSF